MSTPFILPGDRDWRFLFYSHDGMGLGHTRRNLAIAAALVELCPRASVLIASGTDDVHRLGLPPRVEVLKLPGLRKANNEDYASRRLPVDRDDIRDLRSSLLAAAVRSFQPTVVLVDKHPFGARGEFQAGLQVLKDYGGQLVLGLRDILDDPAVVRREWSEHGLTERIAALHDRVFIYGDRPVFDPVAEYDLCETVARRTCFCGYVVSQDSAVGAEARPAEFSRAGRTRPVVLATAGGGEDGFALLERFIEAAVDAPWQGIVITGPMTPEAELTSLRGQAEAAGVLLHTFIPRLPLLFQSVDAMVCMGGYNTLAEGAAQAIPMVCVPRVSPRSEQLIRARAFERLGILRMLHPADATPAALGSLIDSVLAMPRESVRERVESSLNFDGALRAAQELAALAGSPARNAGALTTAQD